MSKLVLKEMGFKQTLGKPVSLKGRAPFSRGLGVNAKIKPAAGGVEFVVKKGGELIRIPADAKHAKTIDGEHTTLVANSRGEVRAVEHLLSALAGLGIDAYTVELDGDQVPVLDASGERFCKKIIKAGRRQTRARRLVAEVKETIVFGDDKGSMAILRPGERTTISALIQFPDPIGEQYFKVGMDGYLKEISWSRSFIRSSCTPEVWSRVRTVLPVLPLDISKSPLLVFRDGNWIVGPKDKEGLEPVRHKILDAIGDLSLLGYPILGEVTLVRPGHDFSRRLISFLSGLLPQE